MPVRQGRHFVNVNSGNTTVLFSWRRVARFAWRVIALSPFLLPLFVFNGSTSVDGLRWLLGLLFDRSAWDTYTAWRVTIFGRVFPVLPWIMVFVGSWSEIGLLSEVLDIIDDKTLLAGRQIATGLTVYDLVTTFVGIIAVAEPALGLATALVIAVITFIPVTGGVEYILQRAWKEA